MAAAMMADADVAVRLRGWARGLYGLEAAVELLLRAFDGRFADPGWPWIGSDERCVWLDADQISGHSGVLSGGEQRILAVVAALATGSPLVRLPEVLAALDRRRLGLVLAALAHAGGSHEHSDLSPGTDGATGWRRLPALVAWPEGG